MRMTRHDATRGVGHIWLPSAEVSKLLTGVSSTVSWRWFVPSGFMTQTFRTPLRPLRKAIWFWPEVVGAPVVKVQVRPAETAVGSSSRATVGSRVTVYVVWAASGRRGTKRSVSGVAVRPTGPARAMSPDREVARRGRRSGPTVDARHDVERVRAVSGSIGASNWIAIGLPIPIPATPSAGIRVVIAEARRDRREVGHERRPEPATAGVGGLGTDRQRVRRPEPKAEAEVEGDDGSAPGRGHGAAGVERDRRLDRGRVHESVEDELDLAVEGDAGGRHRPA